MSRPVADDVIAVLADIRDHFELSGPQSDVRELRKEATWAVARIEFDARRFVNEESAHSSIYDATVRRLGYTGVAEFDHDVDEWFRGRPDALRVAVLAKVTTESQRQRLADVLGLSGSERTTAPAQDLGPPPAERVVTTVSRIIRDTRLSNRVKLLHNYECQLCGYTLTLPGGLR